MRQLDRPAKGGGERVPTKQGQKTERRGRKTLRGTLRWQRTKRTCHCSRGEKKSVRGKGEQGSIETAQRGGKKGVVGAGKKEIRGSITGKMFRGILSRGNHRT